MIQPPKGTRDISPEEMKKLQSIIDRFREIFEKYNFLPLETPAFESFELLSAKGGLGEAAKDEIYYFKDKSDRELGLRFDLTVPLARFVINNPNLTKPFKRYQIGRVWRYDNPQAMRWREFWQADVDVVGSSSMSADTECLAVSVGCLLSLGFKKFSIRINNRKLIEKILLKLGVKENKIFDVFRIIDKLSKIGLKNVKRELKENDIDIEIEDILKISGSNKEILENVKKKFGENEGLKELREIINLSRKIGIEKYLKIDLSLVRGLDYYTGPVFEVKIGDVDVSCGGGGRYDSLIKNLGGPDMPATGISFGLDRLLTLIKDSKILNRKVFVATVNDEVKEEAFKICQNLRKENIISDIDMMDRKLSKQLGYASKMKYPFVLVVGKRELEKKSIKLRDMKKGKEKLVKIKDIVKILNKVLNQ